MEAGWQRLREVHPGVPLLNRQRVTVVFCFCKMKMQNCNNNCAAQLQKVGRAFAALRRKSTKLGGTAEHNFRPFTGTEVFIF